MSGVPPCPSPEVEAQHLLQLIFDHSGEGISVFDAGLRLRAFNARFLELTGVDPALARPGTPLQALLLAQARAGGRIRTAHGISSSKHTNRSVLLRDSLPRTFVTA